jgi:hypothetical protein
MTALTRVQALDSLDGGVNELDGLDLLAPHELGLSRAVEKGDVIHGTPPS